MIVHRMTFHIKPGHRDEALALLVAESQRVNWHRPQRLYESKVGRSNTLSAETEFANLAEYDQYWTDWVAQPAAHAFLEKWILLEEHGGVQELWDLAT